MEKINSNNQFSSNTLTTNNPPERSGGVTAIAILNFIFAFFSLCGSTGAIVSGLFLSKLSIYETMPGIAYITRDPVIKIFSIVGAVVGLIFTAMLIISGIGLLKLDETGRKVGLMYAAAGIIWTLFSGVINFALILPKQQAIMQSEMPEQIGGMIGGAFGSIMGIFCGLIYPVILLIVLNTKSIKEQFEPKGPLVNRH